jgi:hypothetical protein
MVLFEAGDSTRGVSIYIYNNLLYVGAWNNGVSGWTNGTFASTNLIRAGRWHQVVLTLSPSLTLQAGGLKGYLDGAEFGSVNGANMGRSASAKSTARLVSTTASAAQAITVDLPDSWTKPESTAKRSQRATW